MITFREVLTSLRKLGIENSRPVIVHASLSAFGRVNGGAETVAGALLAAFQTVIVPAFTYKTMIIPEVGPEDNAITYGSGKDTNRMAEFFTPSMPVDKMIGSIPEALRKHPKAGRSIHPILSFAGVNAAPILESQTLEHPLAPIEKLAELSGYVLLLGVGNTVNTSIHYGEYLAGRKQFTRWALTLDGIKECPRFPGCSDGFNALKETLEPITTKSQAGEAEIQAVPIPELLDAVQDRLKNDPYALLCTREDCARCNAVREVNVHNN